MAAVGVLAYFIVRGQTRDDAATAVAHARQLLRLEAGLGLRHEEAVQAVIVASDGATTLVNWIYIYGHWPIIVAAAGWLLRWHPDQYRWPRNAMLISGLIGLLFYVGYPVAPPRLLLGGGFIDTVTLHSDAYRALQPPGLVDQYAAFPSMHAGWNLLVGVALFRAARNHAFRSAAALMPILMAVAVVATANHYIVDVLGGTLVALIAGVLATHLDSVRNAPGAGKPAGGSITRQLQHKADESLHEPPTALVTHSSMPPLTRHRA